MVGLTQEHGKAAHAEDQEGQHAPQLGGHSRDSEGAGEGPVDVPLGLCGPIVPPQLVALGQQRVRVRPHVAIAHHRQAGIQARRLLLHNEIRLQRVLVLAHGRREVRHARHTAHQGRGMGGPSHAAREGAGEHGEQAQGQTDSQRELVLGEGNFLRKVCF